MFNPFGKVLGGYSQSDGTIDFYGRINSVLKPEFKILDLGAGRAAWYEDDDVEYRRSLRQLKGKVAEVIAADIDPIVKENRASDRQIVIGDRSIPLRDNSIDLIVADYVLEHIDDVDQFKKEVDRILKVGGYFCARTPHKFHYVSMAARAVNNNNHPAWLRSIQPGRKSIDVFPTQYKLNTFSAVRAVFDDYDDFSFLYRADPSYFFGNKYIFNFLAMTHRLMPAFFSGNLFIFLRKKADRSIPARQDFKGEVSAPRPANREVQLEEIC